MNLAQKTVKQEIINCCHENGLPYETFDAIYSVEAFPDGDLVCVVLPDGIVDMHVTDDSVIIHGKQYHYDDPTCFRFLNPLREAGKQ